MSEGLTNRRDLALGSKAYPKRGMEWRQQGQLVLSTGGRPMPVTEDNKMIAIDHKLEEIQEAKDFDEQYYNELLQ